MFTDYAAIKYLFSKQDAKPRLIRKILLLQEFDIKIKNKNGAENIAVDQLSRLEKPDLNELNNEEINDEFPVEFLMSIKTNKEESPWFADFANYLDEPYIFKACPDGMIRRCVHGSETQKILDECHHGPTGDIMDHRLPERKFLMLDSIGQQYSKKHRLWYKTVTPANVMVAFHEETRFL
ncbi:hypothetical protein Tco_0214460 [Tanacetum coccineum]